MTDKEYWSPEELAMKKALNSIREEYPDFWKDFEEFTEESEPSKTIDYPEHREEIINPDLEKIRQRKFRRRLIVACFLGVCVLSTALAIFINSDTAHAVKFAMEKKYYQAKGWVQATDPERVDDENVIRAVVTEEAEMSKFKEFWDGIMIPQYIPEEYVFEKMVVERYINSFAKAQYVYKNGNDELVIHVNSIQEEASEIAWLKSIEVRNGECEYIILSDELSGSRSINVIFDTKNIVVCGYLSNEELIDIVNAME